MTPFFENIASFPTSIYTVLLGVLLVYWLGSMLGILDLDVLDVEGLELNAGSPHSPTDFLAGLLLRFGLAGPGAAGVPVVLTLTVLVLIGWLLCYYAVHFLFGRALSGDLMLEPGSALRYLAGIPVFFATLVLAAMATVQVIKPLKVLFKDAGKEVRKRILGQKAVVRTSRVDGEFGEVTLDDGGAGLVLKVRALDGQTFAKGDRVVLLDQLDDPTMYSVISEREFHGH